ncbi:mechanosensitive ion channel family [Diaporthe helianthi]|uniref:Mechanosensitive ion channel protein n=1 Tax=Diaporthe helianthi TaxID=158607 RepID=A0A2P5IDJ8_DIAHE|nr:mechanosensitive ion channel family [Diaporthe helianthi]
MTSPVHVDTSEKADQDRLAPDAVTLSHFSDTRDNVNARLMDDLELLRVERQVSNAEREKENASRRRSRSQQHLHLDRHNPEARPEDAFHTLTEPSQLPQISAGPEPTALAKLFKKLRRFPRVFRYFVYAIPVAVLLLTPILLDIYAFPGENPVGGPGGLRLLWFGIWLEVVWCSLWASRILVSMLPFLNGLAAKMVGSSNHKKWKDIGRQMEMPSAGFLWMLGLIASFQPITDDHRASGGNWSDDGDPPYIKWIDIVWKVIIALFVLAASNLVEKILIQWIATSFHSRTYASRIAQNRLEISFLVRLYEYSKEKLAHDDPVWMQNSNGGQSGAKTPMKMVQDNARQAWTQIGKVAGKMAGDFTGRKVMAAGHPRKVVLELLRSQHSSHTLARLIYRTFVRPGEETITLDDLKQAFPSAEDAETCFGVFDKDLNGDISMEELELVCNEIHLEKKAIAASLKDLDSVIKKLDTVFLFIIFIIAVIVFISILSGSAAAALGTSGTTILGLSWMLQATAQEFLQSIIFVFVKHPFDVGDRVTVYGNTGSLGTGDDYYVQEISLLYTEFKKMEGHIVQAPNSLLNTLFILNQRRSSGLADPIELKLKFGISAEMIEELKNRMLDFILENKRDYQSKIISEVRTIDEVYSVTINFIFFHKSNFQNELLRLQRHNKFAAELMRVMNELGIEGPRKMQPGGNESYPFYLAYPPAPMENATKENVIKDQRSGSLKTGPGSVHRDDTSQRPLSPPSPDVRRRRAESQARAQLEHFTDFGDVFEGRKDPAAANLARLQSLREEAALSSQSSGVDRYGRGPSLDRVRTMNSDNVSRHGRGIFRRPRSSSKTVASDKGGSDIV